MNEDFLMKRVFFVLGNSVRNSNGNFFLYKIILSSTPKRPPLKSVRILFLRPKESVAQVQIGLGSNAVITR